MVSRQVRGYLILAGFFLLGVVGGIAAGRAYTQREMAEVYLGIDAQSREAMFVHGIGVELDLDEAQKQHIAAIAAKHRESRRELTQQMYDNCGKPMQELQARMNAEVIEGLSPEKVARYLEVIAERRKQNGMAPR